MLINEMFYSVEGEGIHQGLPTVFIRLQGCNLACKWCDTPDALTPFGGTEMTVSDILRKVRGFSSTCSWVCITGGEPLCQEPGLVALILALRDAKYQIEIFTNGSKSVPTWKSFVNSWCIDIKCPSSGVETTRRDAWFDMRLCDQLKFTVADEKDLEFVRGILAERPNLDPVLLLSPVISLIQVGPMGKRDYYMSGTWLQRCVEFCKENNLRLSLQIHKIIWEAEKRAV